MQTPSGQPVESPRYWDQRIDSITGGAKTKIPYEELEGMFLDQFLLRYFYELMPDTQPLAPFQHYFRSRPWNAFREAFPWAKEMPLLFEQLTGYKLNDIQLNNAIAEWARRCETNRSRSEVR